MESALSDARTIQTAMMRDRVRIERVTHVFDRTIGRNIETVTLVWEGPARYPRADAPNRVFMAGAPATPATPLVLIPWDTEGVEPDDRVTCTKSVSPRMVGRTLWVTDASPRTFQSAVHLTCREVR